MPVPRPKLADDGAIIDSAPAVVSTADPACEFCKEAIDKFHNANAACELHMKTVRCFVKESRAGVLSTYGSFLPGDQVEVPTWEFALPTIRRILETAEEREERIASAREQLNLDRRQKLAAIGGATTQQARARQVAAEVAKRSRDQGADRPPGPAVGK